MDYSSQSDFPTRVPLRVLGLSYREIKSGAYALILAEVGGPHYIPIVIGTAEAQSIAMRLEGIKPPRPITHDLFASFAHAFGIRLVEVFINKFEDGIFTSELLFVDPEGNTMTIDARTSDAIAIAMRAGAPINTTPEIIAETGFTMEEPREEPLRERLDEYRLEPTESGAADQSRSGAAEPAEDDSLDDDDFSRKSIEALENLLASLIADERYEEAAAINKIIKERLSKGGLYDRPS